MFGEPELRASTLAQRRERAVCCLQRPGAAASVEVPHSDCHTTRACDIVPACFMYTNRVYVQSPSWNGGKRPKVIVCGRVGAGRVGARGQKKRTGLPKELEQAGQSLVFVYLTGVHRAMSRACDSY